MCLLGEKQVPFVRINGFEFRGNVKLSVSVINGCPKVWFNRNYQNFKFYPFSAAALRDSELVSEAITSQHSVAPSPNVRLLDEIALKLDVRSMNLANWSSLAVKLEVPRETLKKFERRSTQSPTNKSFEYLGSTCPRMTVKTLEEALTKMDRKDLLAILHEKSPQGKLSSFLKE